MARPLLKNDSATMKLVTLAVLLAGFGSGRKLVADAVFTNCDPGAAVIFTTMLKTIDPVASAVCSESIFPVTVPLVPTAGPVQVAPIKLLVHETKFAPEGNTSVITRFNARLLPRFATLTL